MDRNVDLKLDSQISSVCSENIKCTICKGQKDPSLVVISKIKQNPNFIKLICENCIAKNEEREEENDSPTSSTQELQKSLNNSTNSQDSDTQCNQNALQGEDKLQLSEQSKCQETSLNNLDKQNSNQIYAKKSLDKSCKSTNPINHVTQQEKIEAFHIEPHHLLLQFDEFISQIDSSVKKEKFELLNRSTELTFFLKDALRTIFEIQAQVENMQEDIMKFSVQVEELIYQLKISDNSMDKQNLLQDIIKFVNFSENKITAQIQQQKYTQDIDDLYCKLEYLSETLEPQIFKINSRKYAIKKQTVEQCNKMLLQLNIQQKWKQYSDINMDQESITAGMRGVYRYNISQNGKVSLGTNTGYVYLAMTTTENYDRYDFRNLVPLTNAKNNNYYNNSSKHELSHKLANYFLNQRNEILNLQQQISKIIK